MAISQGEVPSEGTHPWSPGPAGGWTIVAARARPERSDAEEGYRGAPGAPHGTRAQVIDPGQASTVMHWYHEALAFGMFVLLMIVGTQQALQLGGGAPMARWPGKLGKRKAARHGQEGR